MIFLTWFYCNPPEAFVNPFPPQSGRGAGKPRKRAGKATKVEGKSGIMAKTNKQVGERIKNKEKMTGKWD